MADPFDLALVVGETRLGADERDGTRIPGDLTWTTNAEGGCTTLSCSLLREVRDDGPEVLGDLVRVIPATGGETGWVGRLAGKPRTVDTWTQAQTAQAQGLFQALEDDQSVRFLGIDRDLGRWEGPSRSRQLQILAAPLTPLAVSVESGRLKFDMPGGWTSLGGRPHPAAQYQAAPLAIGGVGWAQADHWSVGGDWVGHVAGLDADGGYTGTTYGADWVTTPFGSNPGTQPAAWRATPGARGVEVAVYYPTAPAGSAGDVRWLTLPSVYVVGDHGLPLTGATAADYGLKASDMVRHWVSSHPTLRPGTIVDSGLGIQHFAAHEPTSRADLIRNANAYHAWSYGVWRTDSAGRGLVDFHPYGQGSARTWHIRAGGNGVDLAQDGDNLADLWTRIVVTYQTPDGKQMSVGPPGATVHATSAELHITDGSHPLVAAGIDRTFLFQLSVPTNEATAIAVGNMMLGQLNAARHTGTLTLTGMVEDEYGQTWPAWMVRGGDSVRIVNQTDTAPRLIAEATYTHGTKSVACQLGTNLQTVEAIVAHIGARTTGRI